MSRFNFIDELVLTAANGWDRWGINTSALSAAQAFRIDNVDSYFWSHQDQFDVPIASFPNIAPPFENFIMFAETTRAVRALNGDQTQRVIDLAPGFRYGVWFLSRPIEQADDPQAVELFTEMETNRLLLKKSGVRWYTQAVVFMQRNGLRAIEPVAVSQVLIDEDGSLGGLNLNCRISLVSELSKTHMLSMDDAERETQRNALALLYSPFLAITFLHCKNVTYQDALMTRPEERQAKKYEAKKQLPAATWKVLNIQPIQRTLTTEGNSANGGLVQALHICRGHFKDYRNGRGLFGKFRDIYWWDQHMRGNEAAGVVIKDYNVLAPA